MPEPKDSNAEIEDYESVQLVPDQGEDEGDLADQPSKFRASVSGKDWTVETLVSQMRKGRIDLSPSFQRRNAWLSNRKSKLLESIMLQFPIPQIVLAEKQERPGHYLVLDGKQRLLALRQFFVDDSMPQDTEFDRLTLSGLEVLTDLNGLSLEDLERRHPNHSASIENHSIRTVVLSGWNSERLLLSLFLRLNTGSVALSPQELRQALIHGEFTKWLDVTSGDSPALQSLLNNNHPDRRMVDAELLLRHLAFSHSPFSYSGNLKKFLDETSEHFNKNWTSLSTPLNQSSDEYFRAIMFGLEEVNQDFAFARKWSKKPRNQPDGFERALNRAVLDFQAYSFTFKEVRSASAGTMDAIMERFQSECINNETFSRSISTTTKTTDAFKTRHETWRNIILDATGVDYPLPGPLQGP
ncbi:DUF262 domain-containing protein [Tsukamurella sputi]|uniref:DUF262 domain-containing protein n=1 Tax=Tsukamurella sputi TaxID=2591848 RepID=A0A5C5RRF2_9ACTN|nr:DUF262 domain-containing protein [Tsukamurella sputi]TWS25274.1 DUF262 domain-containing protein [Tsukamurella sputi]